MKNININSSLRIGGFAFLISGLILCGCSQASTNSDSGTIYSANITLQEVKNNTTGTAITSCLDLPSNEDWIPDGVIIQGEKELKPIGITVLDIKNPEVYSGTHRCYEFEFSEILESSGVFSVRKLSTTFPDIITQEECNNVMDKIVKNHAGLVVTCNIGDHGIGFNYDKLPESVSQPEIAAEIQAAFTKTVNGPWEIQIK